MYYMKSTIKQILFGEKENSYSVKLTKEYYKILDDVAANESDLFAKLSSMPKVLALYDKTIKTMDKLNYELINIYYLEGFILGVSLGLDFKKT